MQSKASTFGTWSCVQRLVHFRALERRKKHSDKCRAAKKLKMNTYI